jgi:hypothetical protein
LRSFLLFYFVAVTDLVACFQPVIAFFVIETIIDQSF